MKASKAAWFFIALVGLLFFACKKNSTQPSLNIIGTWTATGTVNASWLITDRFNTDSTFKETTTLLDATGKTIGYISIVTGKYHFSGVLVSATSPIALNEYNLVTLRTPTGSASVSDPTQLVTVNSST